MVMASTTEEQDRRIVLEFCHLLEKSKQLFNGLRDLPQYGELSSAFSIDAAYSMPFTLQVTDNGKLILVELLTSTQSCGSFSSSID